MVIRKCKLFRTNLGRFMRIKMLLFDRLIGINNSGSDDVKSYLMTGDRVYFDESN
jgi:hypothetical protein